MTSKKLEFFYLRSLTATMMRIAPRVLPRSFAAFLEENFIILRNVTPKSKHIERGKGKNPEAFGLPILTATIMVFMVPPAVPRSFAVF